MRRRTFLGAAGVSAVAVTGLGACGTAATDSGYVSAGGGGSPVTLIPPDKPYFSDYF